MIYFDNAASTYPKPPAVGRAVGTVPIPAAADISPHWTPAASFLIREWLSAVCSGYPTLRI